MKVGIIMNLVDDRVFEDTLEILRNKSELPPVFKELKDWLKDQYSVVAYNFVFEKIKYKNPEYRYQLYILLSSTEDYESMLCKSSMDYSKRKQSKISQKFYELVKKYSLYEDDLVKGVWICFNDFSKELKTSINERAAKEAKLFIKDKYIDVPIWDICAIFSYVVVFFTRDIDVKLNLENRICESIRSDYYQILKRYDEFNVYRYDKFNMSFDSKENLDKNYQGNLYWYFK